MLYDIVEVKAIKTYILYIRFQDGLSGEVDISKIVPFEGVFSKLKDISYFTTVNCLNFLSEFSRLDTVFH